MQIFDFFKTEYFKQVTPAPPPPGNYFFECVCRFAFMYYIWYTMTNKNTWCLIWAKSIKFHGYLDKVTLNNLMGGPGDIWGSYSVTLCLFNFWEIILLFSVDRFEMVEFGTFPLLLIFNDWVFYKKKHGSRLKIAGISVDHLYRVWLTTSLKWWNMYFPTFRAIIMGYP